LIVLDILKLLLGNFAGIVTLESLFRGFSSMLESENFVL